MPDLRENETLGPLIIEKQEERVQYNNLPTKETECQPQKDALNEKNYT